MKSGTLIGLLLVLLGGAVVGVWTWRKWNTATSASYQPATFNGEEKEFLHTAYKFLDLQRLSDEEAARRAQFDAVREFARRAATDHGNQAGRLKELALNVDPEMHFEAAKIPDELRQATGNAFDHVYVDSFIRTHEQRLNSSEQFSSIDSNQQLVQFVPLWRTTLNRHLALARNLKEGLPDTASSLTSLLLIGMLCMSGVSLIKLDNWRRRQRNSKRC